MFALSDRGKALEDLYAHNQEVGFIIETRRNRLLGLWAAALLGKDDPRSYAEDLVSVAMEGKGADRIFNRLRADFDASGISVLDEAITSRMSELLSDVARDMR